MWCNCPDSAERMWCLLVVEYTPGCRCTSCRGRASCPARRVGLSVFGVLYVQCHLYKNVKECIPVNSRTKICLKASRRSIFAIWHLRLLLHIHWMMLSMELWNVKWKNWSTGPAAIIDPLSGTFYLVSAFWGRLPLAVQQILNSIAQKMVWQSGKHPNCSVCLRLSPCCTFE